MLLSEAEQHHAILAAIVDSSDDAIISKTLDGIITSWNKSAERIFGYTAEEINGKHISILIPADRLAEEEMIISHLRAGKRVEHYETVRQSKSGKEINISLTISPIKDAQGNIVGASKIARDITKQKENEDLINQYIEQLELLNETGKAISAGLNIDSILQKVTDTTTRLSGASFGAFFYNTIDAKGEAYMLYTLSGAPKESFEKFGMPRNTAVFEMTFSGKGVLRSDDITKDPRYGKNSPHKGMPQGHLPVVSYLAVPVISPTGIVIGGLFFGHSRPGVFKEEHEKLVSAIASQAAIALDNAKLYEELRTINSKKDEFISFASHELKTPLATIHGYLQLAEKMPEQANDFFPRISKQVARLTAIISELLDITKLQGGRMELNFTMTSLPALILENVEAAKQLFPERIIECILPSDDIQVVIDRQKIEQVLINMLTNALKYSAKDAKVLVRAMRLGDQMRISVQDWGIGIAPEYLGKIFSQFYRVAKSSKKTEGLGLGLYIAREIVEGHRGKIWAESEEGKGTTFYIDLPIIV